MKKHLFILSTLILFVSCSCSEFAGAPVSKDFTVGHYTELEVHDAFDVTVSNAVTQVTVTAGENIMPKVVVEVVDNTLKIHLNGILLNNFGSDMKAVIPYNADLTGVDLSGASEFHSEYGLKGANVEVELSGASKFYCDVDAVDVDIDISGASKFYGDILSGEIEMDLSGSSKINGKVVAGNLDLDMSGASDATLEGEVGALRMGLSGSSKIVKKVNGNRYALGCESCEGELSGASDAFIHCDGSIKVRLSGASKLRYTGNANTTDSDTSGSSDIHHDVL